MTFNLTRQQLEEKRAALAKEGVQLDGDSGTVTKEGVTITFTYGEPSLIVAVTNYGGHPSFFVNHAVKNWFSH